MTRKAVLDFIDTALQIQHRTQYCEKDLLHAFERCTKATQQFLASKDDEPDVRIPSKQQLEAIDHHLERLSTQCVSLSTHVRDALYRQLEYPSGRHEQTVLMLTDRTLLGQFFAYERDAQALFHTIEQSEHEIEHSLQALYARQESLLHAREDAERVHQDTTRRTRSRDARVEGADDADMADPHPTVLYGSTFKGLPRDVTAFDAYERTHGGGPTGRWSAHEHAEFLRVYTLHQAAPASSAPLGASLTLLATKPMLQAMQQALPHRTEDEIVQHVTFHVTYQSLLQRKQMAMERARRTRMARKRNDERMVQLQLEEEETLRRQHDEQQRQKDVAAQERKRLALQQWKAKKEQERLVLAQAQSQHKLHERIKMLEDKQRREQLRAEVEQHRHEEEERRRKQRLELQEKEEAERRVRQETANRCLPYRRVNDAAYLGQRQARLHAVQAQREQRQKRLEPSRSASSGSQVARSFERLVQPTQSSILRSNSSRTSIPQALNNATKSTSTVRTQSCPGNNPVDQAAANVDSNRENPLFVPRCILTTHRAAAKGSRKGLSDATIP